MKTTATLIIALALAGCVTSKESQERLERKDAAFSKINVIMMDRALGTYEGREALFQERYNAALRDYQDSNRPPATPADLERLKRIKTAADSAEKAAGIR